MRQIVFEFMGGCMDGCRIEGGVRRSLSTVHLDPVLGYWFGTSFGTPGARFYMPTGGSTPPQENWYEVVDKIDSDEQVIVHVRHILDPRD
jgi:hypothetical protein